MGFGERVSALLETYDNCLSLLKAFKRSTSSKDGKKTSRKLARTREQQALLKHSLRTDRRKVERAYSSRVSESGSEFVKGDSKARSALGKVLRRLNAAIANLMRLASKSSTPLMDYQSLMSLSSSSRVQTLKTFDQLSRRLGSTSSGSGSSSSRGSVVSTTVSSGSKTSKTTTNKSSRSSKRHSSKESSVPKSSASDSRTTHRAATTHESKSSSSSRRERDLGPPRLETSIPTPLLDMRMGGDEERRNISPLMRRPSVMSRFSIRSISSASTKLGEIPERSWRRQGPDDWPGPGALDEYSAPIVYPLKPYQPAVKEKRFMGLFKRGP